MAEMTIPYHKPAADPSIISDAWASGTTYDVGDYCISGDVLYRAILSGSDHQPPDATYWAQTSVTNELKDDLRGAHTVYVIFGKTKANSIFANLMRMAPNIDRYTIVLNSVLLENGDGTNYSSEFHVFTNNGNLNIWAKSITQGDFINNAASVTFTIS